MNKEDLSLGFATRAIHAGQPPEEKTGAVMTPVFQTSTFVQTSPGKHSGYEYARTDNPTRTALQQCLASLEKGRFGVCFASGLATTDAILHTLSPGDHVLSCDDVYGGTHRIFNQVYAKMGIEFTFVDLSNLKEVEKHLRPNTRMLWIESPTNPLLKIFDIEAICSLARKKGIQSVVDNTFMSSYFQNPLELGADLVVHSLTKYMNGHSDVVGGAAITNDPKLHEKLRFIQNSAGGVPGPWDCFLILRGLKTLPLRMEQHQKNAFAVSDFLKKHARVEEVIYPGLPSHPQHKLAKKQMTGFGGMVSFRIKGGLSEARTFLEKVRLFSLAESLGGVESLVEHPGIMTHASVPEETRKKLGISDTLIRLSVGIENSEDLIRDLEQALT